MAYYYYLPIALTIAANVFYHICQKSMPQNINPMLALIITYLTAAVLCVFILIFTLKGQSLAVELGKLNWAPIALGVAIFGLELGFFLAYRVGWNISLGALISNISVSILLIPIGVAVYKEVISTQTAAGIILCIIGLILINR
ncbi:MAG: EamA family transporter [Syntrophomonadaceae bacterium]|jgi:uncharacterized membrane protein|nr:hypothetical protein [Bacillota bacterium]